MHGLPCWNRLVHRGGSERRCLRELRCWLLLDLPREPVVHAVRCRQLFVADGKEFDVHSMPGRELLIDGGKHVVHGVPCRQVCVVLCVREHVVHGMPRRNIPPGNCRGWNIRLRLPGMLRGDVLRIRRGQQQPFVHQLPCRILFGRDGADLVHRVSRRELLDARGSQRRGRVHELPRRVGCAERWKQRVLDMPGRHILVVRGQRRVHELPGGNVLERIGEHVVHPLLGWKLLELREEPVVHGVPCRAVLLVCPELRVRELPDGHVRRVGGQHILHKVLCRKLLQPDGADEQLDVPSMPCRKLFRL